MQSMSNEEIDLSYNNSKNNNTGNDPNSAKAIFTNKKNFSTINLTHVNNPNENNNNNNNKNFGNLRENNFKNELDSKTRNLNNNTKGEFTSSSSYGAYYKIKK